jgi:hypothetical protein
MMEDRLDDLSNGYEKPQQLAIERIVSIFPVPYYWGWTICAGMIFLSTSIAIFHFEHSLSFIWVLLILSILTAQQPIIVIWAYKKMKLLRDYLLVVIDLPQNEILDWYKGQTSIVFDEKRMLATGIIYQIILHLLDFNRFGFVFQTPYSYMIINIFIIIAGIFVGLGLYPLICTALLVYRISKLPMNIEVLFSDNLKIKGLLYSKFTICAASVYAVWGVFRLATPKGLSSPASIGVYSFFALLLVAYFILPQYSIHQMIIKTKNEKLEKLSRRLTDNAKLAFSIPTKDNIASLRDFLDVEQQINERCAWPFGSYEMLHIALIVIIPLLVVLLEIAFNILK